ncbi:MAG TPA: AMIN domain-containing protein [Terriglobales bacterium]|nr:AMIN domain-containing protein [Terriglobales bacterium]
MRPIAAILQLTPLPARHPWKRASIAAFAGLSLWLSALPSAAQAPATLQKVVVFPGSGKVEVQISASRPVTPETQVVTGPDRLVVDFPNTLPGPQLHGQAIHRDKVKAVRVGLFTAKPPVTRVVVDLEAPEPYQIVPAGNSVTVRLNVPGGQPTDSPLAHLGTSAPAPVHMAPVPVHSRPLRPQSAPATTFSVIRVPVNSAMPEAAPGQAARPGLAPATTPGHPDPRPILSAPYPHPGVPSGTPLVAAHTAPVFAAATPAPVAPAAFAPRINVDFHDGKLKIVADHATLAAVLNEVHRRTGAQITIPAGGGMEQVFVSLGPAPAREVLAALLDGSHFNFIMVGSDKNPSQLRSVLLTPQTGGPPDASPAAPVPPTYNPPLAAEAPEYTPPNVPVVSDNPPLPADFSTNDGNDAATNPDSGQPDPGAQQPDAVGPRHPHGHHAAQDPQPEPPQEPAQDPSQDQAPDQSGDQPQ